MHFPFPQLRLEPDGGPFGYQEDGWRQKIDLPACRLVWIGDIVGSSGDSEIPQVRALVRLSPESPEDPFTELTLPLAALPLLSVGRVLKEPPGSDEPSSRYAKGGPSRERRFLGNEWSLDVWFGSGAGSVKTARELPAPAIATLAAHSDFADAPLTWSRMRPASAWSQSRAGRFSGSTTRAPHGSLGCCLTFPAGRRARSSVCCGRSTATNSLARGQASVRRGWSDRGPAARRIRRSATAGGRPGNGRCVRHDGPGADPGCEKLLKRCDVLTF